MRELNFPPPMVTDWLNLAQYKVNVWLDSINQWVKAYSLSPIVSVGITGTQSIPSGVWTKVALNGERYDTAGCFDSVNSLFKPIVAGYYKLEAQVGLDCSVAPGGAASLTVRLYNGATQSQRNTILTATAGNYYTAAFGTFLFNGTTDYMELDVFQNTGVNKNIISGLADTFLTATLIRPV